AYAHKHTHTHTHAWIHTQTLALAHAHTHTHTHKHSHAHSRTHKHSHTHTHTHTHTRTGGGQRRSGCTSVSGAVSTAALTSLPFLSRIHMHEPAHQGCENVLLLWHIPDENTNTAFPHPTRVSC